MIFLQKGNRKKWVSGQTCQVSTLLITQLLSPFEGGMDTCELVAISLVINPSNRVVIIANTLGSCCNHFIVLHHLKLKCGTFWITSFVINNEASSDDKRSWTASCLLTGKSKRQKIRTQIPQLCTVQLTLFSLNLSTKIEASLCLGLTDMLTSYCLDWF